MTLKSEGSKFLEDLRNYEGTVWHKMTKFGMVTQVGERSIFLGGQPRPRPKGRGPSIPNFLAPLPTSKLFELERPNSVWQYTWRGRVLLECQPCPVPIRRDPSVPQIFGTFHQRAHSMRNNNQILHGNQTRREEIFYTVDHECWCAICLR